VRGCRGQHGCGAGRAGWHESDRFGGGVLRAVCGEGGLRDVGMAHRAGQRVRGGVSILCAVHFD
jgi:hypothetical protein